jgi:hypothetical protein
MVAAGILLGVMVFLIGTVGGFTILPEATDTAQSMAEQSGQGDTLDNTLSNTHQTLLGYLTGQIAPFIAFLMAPMFGLVAGTQMSSARKTKQFTAAAGTFVGAILFVFIVTFIASMVVPDLTDFPLGALGTGMGGGEAAALSAVETGLGSIQFLNTLINGVIVGLLSAGTAAATVYITDDFL